MTASPCRRGSLPTLVVIRVLAGLPSSSGSGTAVVISGNPVRAFEARLRRAGQGHH